MEKINHQLIEWDGFYWDGNGFGTKRDKESYYEDELQMSDPRLRLNDYWLQPFRFKGKGHWNWTEVPTNQLADLCDLDNMEIVQ